MQIKNAERKIMSRSFKVVALVGLLMLASCAGSSDTTTTGKEAISLQGAGATFPYPLYSKWFNDYNKKNPKVKIDYQSIGSGGGIKQITERTVDFGASDAPMSNDEMGKAPGIQHIPTVLGADVIIYNLPAVKETLRFAPDTIAGIFLGKISKWNDAAIGRD